MMLFNQLPIPLEKALNRSCLSLLFQFILYIFKHNWPSSGPTNGKWRSCLGLQSSPLQTDAQSMHAYANLSNFLPDLVEAIRAELSLNIGCKTPLKQFTNCWKLHPVTQSTQIYLQSKEHVQPNLRKTPFSRKTPLGLSMLASVGTCPYTLVLLGRPLSDAFICVYTSPTSWFSGFDRA